MISVITAASISLQIAASAGAEAGIDFQTDDFEVTDSVFVEEEASEPEILYEIISLRDEYSKRFMLSDGNVQIARYDSAVHFLDENGEWKDIDNSLQSSDAIDSEDFNGYENKANEIKVKFSKSSDASKLFKYQFDKSSITWGLSNADKKAAKISKRNAVVYSGDDDKLALENTQSGVTYTDIMPSTDLQYTVIGNTIKENIIIKDRKDNYDFTFDIKTKKCTLQLEDDGSISVFNKDNEQIALIPVPFMYDSEGVYSQNVNYSLNEYKKGKYHLTISADPEWINSDERQFPVTIDPIIEKKYSNGITGATVNSKNPSVNFSSIPVYYVGNDNTFYNSRSYFKIDVPDIGKSNIVVKAEFNLYQTASNPSDFAERNIYAYKLTQDWDATKITWNNKPTNQSTISDYMALNKNNSTVKTIDITGMVREWYSDISKNYGFVLMGDSEPATYGKGSATFVKSLVNTNFTNAQLPSFKITYRNNKGIEDYWTYHSVSADNSGTAYINDFTGNLVFVNTDIAESGNRYPLTLSHVYNGYNANNQYRQPTPSSAVLYNKMNFGLGWQLSAEETIVAVFGNSNRYVYCDGDGTEHHMLRVSNEEDVFLDEDGLGLTLSIDSSRKYKLSDNSGNYKTFDSAGYLTSCVDSNGQKIKFTYNNSQLVSITDGAGRATKLTYDSNNYLNSIKDPAGRETTYTYNNAGYLTKITYADGTYSAYAYDSDGMLLRTHDSESAYRIHFTYSSDKAKRVKSYQEYVKTGTSEYTPGQKVLISYNVSDFETTYTSSGKDNTINTSDDIKNVYIFDNYGRTVSSYSTNKNKTEIYGAQSNSYVSASNNGKVNKVKDSANVGGTNPNLLKSNQCESLSGWTLGSMGASNSSVTGGLDSSTKFLGNSSLRVASNSAVSNSTVGYKQTVTLGAGSYTASGYIRTSSVSGTGAGIAVAAPDGTVIARSKCVTGTTNTSIDNGWQRISMSFTAPTSANYSIIFGITNGTGTAFFDCLQLESGSNCSNVNLLENAGMQTLSNWNNNSSKYIATGLIGKGLAISGNPGSKRYLSQTVAINTATNDTFVLSGWAKANSVSQSGTRAFRLRAVIKYGDNSTQTVKAPFLSRSSAWQYTSVAVVPQESGTIASITVYCDYDYNCNTVCFDNISLTKDIAQSYTYDNNGNVLSVVDNAKNKSTMSYSNNDLVKQVNPSGYDYTYTYDKKHNLITATSENDVKYAYTYDSYGNPLTLTASDSGNTMNIRSTAEYSSNGNYLASLTDSRGHKTTYDYSANTGLLNKVTDPLNNSVIYRYNAKNQRLTTVYYDKNNSNTLDTVESSVAYAYSKGRLSAITHNDFKYNFAYDIFGNLLSTKVGNTALSTNTYGANNGNLIKTVYGNGCAVEFVYDNLDRITAQKIDGTVAYRWYYDNNGNIDRMLDVINNISYVYEYDLTGRLVRSYSTKGTSKLLSTENQYDDQNRIKSATYILPNNAKQRYFYSYSRDNLVTGVSLPASSGLSYSYDDLNRRTLRRIAGQNVTTQAETYSYYSPGQYAATNLVNKITYADNSTLSYTYNSNNNIIAVTDENGKRISYKYDGMGQLIRENNPYTNRTTVYSYDKGGNITSAKEYAYTTAAELGTVKKTNTYTYGDSNWKDKLTAYNGKTITYDKIGNPLTYRDSLSFTWKNGRQLASLQNGSSVINYTYNADGVRIGKSGSRAGTFIVSGTQILREINSVATIDYLYDENGSPIGLTYKGTTYYYRKNLQGDIINITDSTGAKVVTYTYNAWGKIMSMTGNMELAVNNPFRYRGYYYDVESGLYYLNSRYYDPQTGRFINADDTDTLLYSLSELTDKNLFAYCDNNPIMHDDKNGNFWNFVVGAVGGLIVGGGVQIISNLISGNNWSDGLATAAITGAASGLLAASGAGLALSITGNAAISSLGNAANQIKNKGFRNFDFGDMIIDGLIGGVAGAVGGRGMGKSVNIRKLNNNLTKKVFSRSSKIAKKGVRYYVSQTRTIYKNNLFKPLIKSGRTSIIGYGMKSYCQRKR